MANEQEAKSAVRKTERCFFRRYAEEVIERNETSD